MYVAVPSRAPELTSVSVLNSTSVRVEWKKVSEAFTHGIITKYVIFYTDGIDTRNKEVPASLLEAVINGLRQSTEYSFQVTAETVKGPGPKSDPKNATTEGKDIKIIICFPYARLGLTGYVT